MRSLFLALALCASVFGLAQTTPDSSTPEKTVKSFWTAWNARDAKAFLSLLADFPADPEREKAVTSMAKDLFMGTPSDIEVVQSGGDAVVIYSLTMMPPTEQAADGATPIEMEDMVRLKQTPEGWRILKTKKTSSLQTYGLSAFAAYLQGPQLLAASKGRLDDCAQNIRQLGLALIMYAGDFEDVIKVAPSQSEVRKAIAPYLKSDKQWECPGHAGTAFSFNVKLAGHSFTELDDPSQSVLFYEGEKGNLRFGENGRAWVCFADGHVKAVTKEEAATLRWTVSK